ncbi:MAG: nuclear transport factor 2 family protein [Flammeovirgaceae bacterium]
MKRSIYLFIFLVIYGFTLKAQPMENRIQQTVSQLFIATDQQDWNTVESLFHTEVLLDYTSMAGGEPATLSPQQITTAWKGLLPGFEHTHHQLGNFQIKQQGNQYQVFCYGTATHYLPHEAGNVWTVVGSYEFELVPSGKSWKVSKMVFHFKYQDGNTNLPQVAQSIVKATH